MLKICSEYTVEDIVEHPLTIKKISLIDVLFVITLLLVESAELFLICSELDHELRLESG